MDTTTAQDFSAFARSPRLKQTAPRASSALTFFGSVGQHLVVPRPGGLVVGALVVQVAEGLHRGRVVRVGLELGHQRLRPAPGPPSGRTARPGPHRRRRCRLRPGCRRRRGCWRRTGCRPPPRSPRDRGRSSSTVPARRAVRTPARPRRGGRLPGLGGLAVRLRVRRHVAVGARGDRCVEGLEVVGVGLGLVGRDLRCLVGRGRGNGAPAGRRCRRPAGYDRRRPRRAPEGRALETDRVGKREVRRVERRGLGVCPALEARGRSREVLAHGEVELVDVLGGGAGRETELGQQLVLRGGAITGRERVRAHERTPRGRARPCRASACDSSWFPQSVPRGTAA